MSKRARQSSAAKMDVEAGPTDGMCLAIVDYWCGTMDTKIYHHLRVHKHWDKIFTPGNELMAAIGVLEAVGDGPLSALESMTEEQQDVQLPGLVYKAMAVCKERKGAMGLFKTYLEKLDGAK